MNKQELIKKYEHIYESSHRPFMDGGLFSRGEDAGTLDVVLRSLKI